MRIVAKDSVQTADQAKAMGLNLGAHILTITEEADGALELASEKAELKARVISTERTISGGFQVQVAVEIIEPQPEAPPVAAVPLTPDEEAIAYLKSKDFGEVAIKSQLERFGAARILAARDREAANRDAELDKELAETLGGGKTAPEVVPPAGAAPAVN